MESTNREKRAWPAAVVLVVSMLVHAALLLMPLPAPRHESSRLDEPRMVVDLLPRPTDSPAESPERLPEPEQPPRAETRPLQEAAAAGSEMAAQPPARRPSPPDTADAPASSSADATAERVQAQLLSAARTLGRESERAEEEKGLQYDAAPTLPSRPGWLDQYTGRVTPTVEQWRDNDGSRNSRIVTASGQVVCVRTRAPTIDEVFNPWMTSAVPMVRGCGRERPDSLDATNPWLRRPVGDGE